MSLSAFFSPFGRIRRLAFLSTLVLTLLAGYGALVLIRFHAPYSFLGLVLLLAVFWTFICLLCNRTRDADASAGWMLVPLFVTGFSLFAVWKIGYYDFSDFILGPATTRVDKIATAPFRPLTMFASVFIPAAIGALLSGIAWIVGFIGLAVLPSRDIAR